MKAIAQFETPERAALAIDALKLRGLYGCMCGSKPRGYEVLVREEILGTANEVLKSFKLTPEAN